MFSKYCIAMFSKYLGMIIINKFHMVFNPSTLSACKCYWYFMRTLDLTFTYITFHITLKRPVDMFYMRWSYTEFTCQRCFTQATLRSHLVCLDLITATSEDYQLLERMNKATISKYVEMKHIASNISKAMTNLHEKC